MDAMHKLIKLLLYSAPFCIQLFNLLLPSERLYLKQADILENKTSADQVVKSLSGNVVFKKGDLTLKCDQARQFEMKNISVLYDNVSALSLYKKNNFQVSPRKLLIMKTS